MRLDISKPEGRVDVAFQAALKHLRLWGLHREASELAYGVSIVLEDGPDDKLIREMITEATAGAVEFYDSRESVR